MNPSETLCLVVVRTADPHLLGMRVWVRTSPARLGRAPDCEIVINARDVSRHHLRFERRGDGWIVVDESSHGTVVNDLPPREETALVVGDRIHVGHVVLRVEDGSSVQAADATTTGVERKSRLATRRP